MKHKRTQRRLLSSLWCQVFFRIAFCAFPIQGAPYCSIYYLRKADANGVEPISTPYAGRLRHRRALHLLISFFLVRQQDKVQKSCSGKVFLAHDNSGVQRPQCCNVSLGGSAITGNGDYHRGYCRLRPWPCKNGQPEGRRQERGSTVLMFHLKRRQHWICRKMLDHIEDLHGGNHLWYHPLEGSCQANALLLFADPDFSAFRPAPPGVRTSSFPLI